MNDEPNPQILIPMRIDKLPPLQGSSFLRTLDKDLPMINSDLFSRDEFGSYACKRARALRIKTGYVQHTNPLVRSFNSCSAVSLGAGEEPPTYGR